MSWKFQSLTGPRNGSNCLRLNENKRKHSLSRVCVSCGRSGGKCLFLMAFEKIGQGREVRQQIDLAIGETKD